jgi:hypothetical protein
LKQKFFEDSTVNHRVKHANNNKQKSMTTTTEQSEAIHWPNEIITTVLSYCRESFLIHTAGLVNKQWNESMKQPVIWRTKSLSFNEKSDGADSIPFIKQCDITSFTIDNAAQANVILTEFHSTMKKLDLSWSWSEEEVAKLEFTPTLFEELEEFTFSSYFGDTIKKWLQLMPKLTLLDGSFDLDDDFKDGILACKELKKLDTNAEFDEAFAIRMFNGLTHLEEAVFRLADDATGALWDQILQIPGLLDRMKLLQVRQYGTGPITSTRPKRIPQFKNLKTLLLDGQFNSHAVLLWAAQNSVETLTLDVADIEVDFTGITFPKLKEIVLYSADAKAIAELVSGGNNTLEEITIRDTKGSPDVPSVYLDLPKLKDLTLQSFPLSIMSLLLKDNEGAGLKLLNLHDADYEDADEAEVEKIAKLFTRMHTLDSYAGPPDLFKFVPAEALIKKVEIESTKSESPFALDDSLIDRILKCAVLEKLSSSCITSVTADNWIPRILKACPKLVTLDIPKSKLIAEQDLSQVEVNEVLRSFEVHSTNLKAEDRLQLLEKLKEVRTIGVHFIPVQEYSDVIVDLNKFDQFEIIHLYVETNGDRIEECELLTKHKQGNLLRVYFDGEGTDVKLEDLMLLTLCANLESENASTYYSSDLNPETFFPAPYNVKKTYSETEAHAMLVTKIVLPDVIQRIKGISEEKRQTLLDNLLSADEHPVLKDMCSTLSFKLESASAWDSEITDRNTSRELETKVEQLEDRIKYLEGLLNDNNIPFDPAPSDNPFNATTTTTGGDDPFSWVNR